MDAERRLGLGDLLHDAIVALFAKEPLLSFLEALSEFAELLFAHELWISLDDKADYDASVAKIRAVVDGYPGLYRDVQTYLQERMKEVLTGASGSVVVRIYGSDLEVLRERAAAVGKEIGAVKGVANLKVEPQVLVAQLEITLDPGALARFGLTPGDVRRTVATLLQGTRVGEVYRNDQVIDVVVWGDHALRGDVPAVRDLRIALPGPATTTSGAPSPGTPAGALPTSAPASPVSDVRLADVASVDFVPAPNIVLREAASRRIDVTCDARGRDLGAVVSLGSLVGFVTVLGIAARNGIMMVAHFRHLETQEGMTFGRELVVRGAMERVVPIAMTALATGLALVPLVVSGAKPGSEIEYPMAVVILGGLVTSTLLNLLLVPPLYVWLGPPAAKTEAGSLIDFTKEFITAERPRELFKILRLV